MQHEQGQPEVPLHEVHVQECHAHAVLRGSELIVSIAGNAEYTCKSALDDLIDAAHAAAIQRRLPEVVLDLRGAAFMDSACLKALVRWVLKLQTESSTYRIRLLSRASLPWQRRSTSALAQLAGGFIRVEASDG